MKQLKCYDSYESSLAAERFRERQWRKTRQGAFESEFVSFEGLTENYFPLAAVLSRTTEAEFKEAQRQYKTAHERVRRHTPECLQVFNLILKNGKERQKSIWEMVEKIKKQSGVLKKTRSMKPQKGSMSGTVPRFFNSSVLKTKTAKRPRKRLEKSTD